VGSADGENRCILDCEALSLSAKLVCTKDIGGSELALVIDCSMSYVVDERCFSKNINLISYSIMLKHAATRNPPKIQI
jgi:hypothetical protein